MWENALIIPFSYVTTGSFNVGMADAKSLTWFQFVRLTMEEQESLIHRFDSYSKKVISNIISNQLKKYVREQNRSTQEISFEEYLKFFDFETWDDYHIEKHKVSSGNHVFFLDDENLCDAINNMRASYRNVLILMVLAEFTAEETAELLKIQQSSVWRYKSLALKELREKSVKHER